MAKRVAVLAVNPVNGLGLFHYLETFFEHKIPYKVFAVAPTPAIRTNSGIALTADGTIAELKGHEAEFDAVVFACGDAMPVFAQHADEAHNRDLAEVLRTFAGQGKTIAGHCAAGMLYDIIGIADGKRIAVHPLAKLAIQTAVATDAPAEVDGNLFTAREEHALPELLPRLLEALA